MLPAMPAIRSKSSRLRALVPALLLLAGAAPPAAHAATLSWKQAVSGNAGTAGSWNPGQIPVAGDVLEFNVAGAYTVTYDASVPSVTAHSYRQGTVTVVAGTHSTSGSVIVGNNFGEVATMILTTGTLTAGQAIIVGSAANTNGTLNVNDDDADLLQSSTTFDVVVGSIGTGTLNVTGGGLVDAGDKVILGNSTTSTGTALVSGVNASPQVRSTLTSSGSDGDLVIGNSGTGTLSIAAGGQALATDDMRVAVGSASQGTVTVDGAVGAIVSQLTIADDLDLSRNDVAGTATGIGSLRVQNFGLVSVAGTTRVGDPDGGTGRLEIRPQGVFSTRDLLFNDAHGVLDFQGGTLSINGGLFDPPGTAIVVDDPQFESLQFHNSAIATFDGGSAAGYGLVIGDTQEGGVNLDSGAHVTHTQGVISVANGPGSTGVLNVTGDALLDGAGLLVVGQGGNGELNMGDGAGVFLSEMNVGYSAGSNGFVSVAGAGARIALDRLSVGGHGTTSGGVGALIVGNGGTVDISAVSSPGGRILAPGGTLTVNAGGTFNALNNFDLAGRAQIAGGTMNVLSLNLSGSGELAGYGTMNGRVAVNAAGCVIHAVGGTLTLGSSTDVKGFNSVGTLICESLVSLRDADAATSLGNVVLGPGNLALPPMGGTVQAGKTMSGAAIVIGALTMAGTLSPGNSAGSIVVSGNYTQTSTGKMTLQLGDASTGQYDRLSVSANAALAGTLDIQLLPGFVPEPGEEFTIVQCGIARSGTFTTVTLNGQAPGSQFTVLYNAATVVVHVNGFVDVPPGDPLPVALAFTGRSGAWANAAFDLALPKASRVAVRLYDVSGRSVGTLLDADCAPGVRRLALHDSGLRPGAGVYFGRATIRAPGAPAAVRTAKITLLN